MSIIKSLLHRAFSSRLSTNERAELKSRVDLMHHYMLANKKEWSTILEDSVFLNNSTLASTPLHSHDSPESSESDKLSVLYAPSEPTASIPLRAEEIEFKLVTLKAELKNRANTDFENSFYTGNDAVGMWLAVKNGATHFALRDQNGNNPFHRLAMYGEEQIFQYLRHTFPEKTDSVLYYETKNELRFLIKKMQSAKFDSIINQPNNEGKTPLYIALYEKQEMFFSLMREHKAHLKLDDRIRINDIYEILAQGLSKEMYDFAVSKFKPLKERLGLTDLYFIIHEESPKTIKKYIDKLDPKELNLTNSDGETILHWAIDIGRPEIVELLVDKMDPEALVFPNRESASPLIMMIIARTRSHDPEMYNEMITVVLNKLETKDLAYHNGDKRTALHYAILSDNREIAGKLIDKMSNEHIEQRDYSGRTVLEYAIEKMEDTEIVNFIIKKMSASEIQNVLFESVFLKKERDSENRAKNLKKLFDCVTANFTKKERLELYNSAIKKKESQLVSLLLTTNKNDFFPLESSYPFLQASASDDRLEIFKLFAENGILSKKQIFRTIDGSSLIGNVIQQGHADVLEFMCSKFKLSETDLREHLKSLNPPKYLYHFNSLNEAQLMKLFKQYKKLGIKPSEMEQREIKQLIQNQLSSHSLDRIQPLFVVNKLSLLNIKLSEFSLDEMIRNHKGFDTDEAVRFLVDNGVPLGQEGEVIPKALLRAIEFKKMTCAEILIKQMMKENRAKGNVFFVHEMLQFLSESWVILGEIPNNIYLNREDFLKIVLKNSLFEMEFVNLETLPEFGAGGVLRTAWEKKNEEMKEQTNFYIGYVKSAENHIGSEIHGLSQTGISEALTFFRESFPLDFKGKKLKPCETPAELENLIEELLPEEQKEKALDALNFVQKPSGKLDAENKIKFNSLIKPMTAFLIGYDGPQQEKDEKKINENVRDRLTLWLQNSLVEANLDNLGTMSCSDGIVERFEVTGLRSIYDISDVIFEINSLFTARDIGISPLEFFLKEENLSKIAEKLNYELPATNEDHDEFIDDAGRKAFAQACLSAYVEHAFLIWEACLRRHPELDENATAKLKNLVSKLIEHPMTTAYLNSNYQAFQTKAVMDLIFALHEKIKTSSIKR